VLMQSSLLMLILLMALAKAVSGTHKGKLKTVPGSGASASQFGTTGQCALNDTNGSMMLGAPSVSLTWSESSWSMKLQSVESCCSGSYRACGSKRRSWSSPSTCGTSVKMYAVRALRPNLPMAGMWPALELFPTLAVRLIQSCRQNLALFHTTSGRPLPCDLRKFDCCLTKLIVIAQRV